MPYPRNFPTQDQLAAAPVYDRADTLRFHSDETIKRRKAGQPGPFSMLVPAERFLDLVEALANHKFAPRLLRAWVSLGLISPSVEKDGRKDLFVYPIHFEQVAVILTLRNAYQLPLKVIRAILEHFPDGRFHVLTSRKLTTEELLDAAKMLPGGFKLENIFMAKACDAMLGDTLSADEALMAATEPGDELKRLEEEKILARLDEIKDWVKAGGRQKFARREAAKDFQDLAWRQRFAMRLHKKILARQTRKQLEAAGKKG